MKKIASSWIDQRTNGAPGGRIGGGNTEIDDAGDSVTSCAKEEEDDDDDGDDGDKEESTVEESQMGHLSPLRNFLPEVKWRREQE